MIPDWIALSCNVIWTPTYLVLVPLWIEIWNCINMYWFMQLYFLVLWHIEYLWLCELLTWRLCRDERNHNCYVIDCVSLAESSVVKTLLSLSCVAVMVRLRVPGLSEPLCLMCWVESWRRVLRTGTNLKIAIYWHI